MSQYTRHPLSAAWGDMPQAEFSAMVDDVEKRGQLEHIVLFGGLVLDGWHRYRACVECGIAPMVREFNGGDALTFVISANALRRHQTPEQRAAAVLACVELRRAGDNQHAAPVRNEVTPSDVTSQKPIRTIAEVAKLAKVSKSTVDRVIAKSKPAKPAPPAAPIPREPVIAEQVEQAPEVKDTQSVPAASKFKRQKLVEAMAETLQLKRPMKDLSAEAKRSNKNVTLPMADPERAVRVMLKESDQRAVVKFYSELGYTLHNMGAITKWPEAMRVVLAALLPAEAEAMRASKDRAHAEFMKHAAMRKGIPAQMSEADYKFLLNVLHPDRAPGDRREKFARAFDIVRKLDAYIEAFKPNRAGGRK